ncbi:hypothetical protein V6R21_24845 [Limibacter armeniacum]|uniref:hypothetical protein n=1 Tax=Limibacter armeniacum TaxID=466084 RepID=UPI002FE67E4A
MPSKILNISDVSLEIEKTNPLRLLIKAKGTVPTDGWTNGILVPFVYVVPPIDGIYEFDFVADPPTGISTQAISKIDAEFVWEDFPVDLRGIKIYASENSVVTMIDAETKNNLDESSTPSTLRKVTASELLEAKKASNHFSIVNAFVWEKMLEVQVRFGGGCKEHDFELLWDGTQKESFPPIIPLVITHDNNGDPCKAIVIQNLQFDLTDVFGTEIIIELEGWGEKLKM